MSDDDAPRASATPPPNCAEDVTSSTIDGLHALDKSNATVGNGNEKNVEVPAKVKPSILRNEAKEDISMDTSLARTDDHETSKGKRKCVQFAATLPGATDDMTLRKFIEGDEILDKKNPFKTDDRNFFEQQDVLDDAFFTKSPGDDIDDANKHNDDGVDNENEFITKEEILRQSKYVMTYVKNPDKRLNYDKSVIQKLNAIKAKGRDVRDVRDVVVVDCSSLSPITRPPIPAPRAIYRQSDRNNNNRRQHSPQLERMRNPKPIPRARRDYVEVKVRTGSAEAEESLYDSNEVVLNALKFDSRFRQVQFGSQDDIDTIAEKTEDAAGIRATSEDHTVSAEVSPSSTPTKIKPEARKTTFAEDVKKSFSNTVKSADFMKYLQSKGLSLVPAKQQRAIDVSKRPEEKPINNVRLSCGSNMPATPPRPPTKLSVLTKFLQNSLFTPKTPNDPAYSPLFPRSSTPLHFTSQTQARTQLSSQNCNNVAVHNGSIIKRPSSVDVKPKVSFKQFDHVDAASIRRPVSVNDFDRPKLRTHFSNRSMSRIDSTRRPMKNAGVQVNLANGTTDRSAIFTGGRPVSAVRWQSGTTPVDVNLVKRQPIQPVQHRSDNRFYVGAPSLHTVAPLYSEPLREVLMKQDATRRSAVDSGYHIYEQTPDNLRREMLHGKISNLSNGHLNNGWHPQDRRSYSSMQDGVVENTTYGRLRPLYVSSPLSTQSTPIRRASDTLDREQILHRIYDFCRRSIRNTSKSSVHSNQTEPLYQGTPPVRLVGSGSFPIERPRVQRVQSLSNSRSDVGSNFIRMAAPQTALPVKNNTQQATLPRIARRSQHDRNIENVYAFVNKKMNQLGVGKGDGPAAGGSTRSGLTAPSTMRRVTFSSNDPEDASYGFEEADYVNIRGAPDGLLTHGIDSL